jgi:hypothetical protein
VRAAPLSPVVGQSDFARLGCLTTLLPRFNPHYYTLVREIKAKPPPSVQWWRGLSAVKRVLVRWSSGKGESNLRTHDPKFCTFSPKVTRGLHPTPPFNPKVRTPASPKAVTFPEGLVDTQHPPVPDAHPVVSAQSQSVHKGTEHDKQRCVAPRSRACLLPIPKARAARG